MTEQEKELMKTFKIEELEERLEMRLWDGHSDCQYAKTGQTYDHPVSHV